jgi:GTP-binding protein
MEPVEEVIIEVPAEHVGTVQMELGQRRATLKEQFASFQRRYQAGLRNADPQLAGYAQHLADQHQRHDHHEQPGHWLQPVGASLQQLRNGVLISFEAGVTTPYALQNAEARGTTFVGPAEKVYAGQIIGLNTRQEDMEINVCKAKHLTNMRSSSSDGVVQLTPPVPSLAWNSAWTSSKTTNCSKLLPKTCACASASSTPTSENG